MLLESLNIPLNTDSGISSLKEGGSVPPCRTNGQLVENLGKSGIKLGQIKKKVKIGM